MNTPTMQLLAWATSQGPETTKRINQALLIAQQAHRRQKRHNGDPYIEHPVAVALILIKSGVDTDSVVAAVLHDVLDGRTPVPLGLIRCEFGDLVADLLAAFAVLDSSPNPPPDVIDRFDRRVLQLKIADRLHNMRTIGCFDPEKQCQKANHTREVVTPVARAVGLTDLADELDALATAVRRAHTPASLQLQDQRHQRKVPGVRVLHSALSLGAALLPAHHRGRVLQDWEGELHAAADLAERVQFTASMLLHLPHLAFLTRRTNRP